MAVQTNLQLSGKALLSDSALIILCDDEITQQLAKNDLPAIEEAAAVVIGHTIKVKIRLAEERPDDNSALDELVERAHKLNIEVTEFEF